MEATVATVDQAAKLAEMKGFGVTLGNRKTPWELGMDWGQAGDRSSELLTASEMLEASGLAGWNVQKEQDFRPNGEPVPGSYHNVTEDGRILGTGLGRSYVVHQTEDVFAFGDNIVDDGQAKWERAGGFKNGSIVFGCMELTHLGITVPGDGPIKPYLLLVNTFDGSYPTQGVLAYVRPRCVNTFQMARGTATPHRFSIQHRSGLEGKVLMARAAIGIAFNQAQETQEVVTRLAMTKVVDKQVRELFAKAIWPSAKTDEDVTGAPASAAFENYMTSETLDGIRGTAWGAFNGVTEFIDHETKYAGKSASTAADVKGTSLIWGVGERRKEVALEKLLQLAK